MVDSIDTSFGTRDPSIRNGELAAQFT
jgi:hypothetical protein